MLLAEHVGRRDGLDCFTPKTQGIARRRLLQPQKSQIAYRVSVFWIKSSFLTEWSGVEAPPQEKLRQPPQLANRIGVETADSRAVAWLRLQSTPSNYKDNTNFASPSTPSSTPLLTFKPLLKILLHPILSSSPTHPSIHPPQQPQPYPNPHPPFSHNP